MRSETGVHMLELGPVFLAAWKRIRPLLDTDPAERHRRLARLGSAAIQNRHASGA